MLNNTSFVAKCNNLPEEAFVVFASKNIKLFQLTNLTGRLAKETNCPWTLQVSTSFSDALIAAFKAAKGLKDGNCNRTACQMPGAIYFNHGTYLWYCYKCAIWLNTDPYNARDAQRLFGHDLCTLEEDPKDSVINGLTNDKTDV